MVASTVAANVEVPRSWADIVKGSSEMVDGSYPEEQPVTSEEKDIASMDHSKHAALSMEPEMEPAAAVLRDEQSEVTQRRDEQSCAPGAHADSQRLRPGLRGSRQCLCYGEVLTMLSHYGWLGVFGEIDHPLAAKHFGRIYVHSEDVVDGRALSVGDKVSFYLYADGIGLGAEACKVESSTALRAGASEFIPNATLRADAAEFVPGAVVSSASSVSNMFVRMSRAFDSIPANCYVEMAGVINSAYFEDDSSDDDDDVDALADADKESVDETSDHSSTVVTKVIQEAPWKQLTCGKSANKSSSKMASSPGILSDSTDVGLTSESESESESKVPLSNLAAPFGVILGFPVLRLPPGLEDEIPVPYGIS